MTMLASASSVPGSKPKCMECAVGRHIVRGLCAITGMAQRSARWASTGTAAAGSAPVTISGRSAATIHSASVAIDFGSGYAGAACARGLIGAIGSGSGAASGSRGSTM